MSKYDFYWQKKLDGIKQLLEEAYKNGSSSYLDVSDIQGYGERDSWHGVVEIFKDGFKKGKMAHTKSLGNVILENKLLDSYGKLEFRLIISRDMKVRAEQLDVREKPIFIQTKPVERRPIMTIKTEKGIYLRIHEIIESLPLHKYPISKEILPENGIYFFYENGERILVGNQTKDRIVRVGTHREQSRFPKRIFNHFSGNKNISVFRKHLGGAVIRKRNLNDPRLKQWLKQDTPTFPEIEREVTEILRDNFSFRCIYVEDKKERLGLEKRLIATLSKCSECLPSEKWLGQYAASEVIQKSGLWNTQHVTSNNIMTEDAIERIKELAERSNPNRKKALFLIPCCSEKRPDGDNPPWNETRLNQESNGLQFLDDHRVQMIDFYSGLSKEKAFDYYKNRGTGENRTRKVIKAWQKNLRIHECKTTKAIDRYDGNLYKSLNSNVMVQLYNSELDNVLIVSALMGIITPTDLIPDYELMMMDKSPNNRKVWAFWKKTFAIDQVKQPLQRIFSKFDYIYCLMSTTTGYVASVAEILSDYRSYCIIPQERGQTNKLRSWGRVLSKVLLNAINSPDGVRKVAETYNCKMEKLSNIKK